MWRGRILLACALVLVAVLSMSMPARGVTFGTADTAHTYVGAWIGQFADGTFGWCSGDLVSPHVFLTAGHCVALFLSRGATPKTTWVTFDLNIFPPGVAPPSTTPGPVPGFKPPAPDWLAVSSFVADPLFNPAYMGPSFDPHDLGAVILKKGVTSVGFATLAPVGLLDTLQTGTLTHASLSILGYGWDQNNAVTAQRRITSAPILGVAPHWLYYQATNAATGTGGICIGDSGGPEILTQGGTEYLVASNTLFTGSCTTGAQIGYRVDTSSAHTFVMDEIAANP